MALPRAPSHRGTVVDEDLQAGAIQEHVQVDAAAGRSVGGFAAQSEVGRPAVLGLHGPDPARSAVQIEDPGRARHSDAHLLIPAGGQSQPDVLGARDIEDEVEVDDPARAQVGRGVGDAGSAQVDGPPP